MFWSVQLNELLSNGLSDILQVVQILWSLISFPTSEGLDGLDGSDGLDDGEANGGDEDTGDGANEVNGADNNLWPPVRVSDVEEELLNKDVEWVEKS